MCIYDEINRVSGIHHWVKPDGVKPNAKKLEAVITAPTPTDVSHSLG